jgi:hypothetical protein
MSEFESTEELVSEAIHVTSFISHVTLAYVFCVWEQRVQKYTAMEGDYID